MTWRLPQNRFWLQTHNKTFASCGARTKALSHAESPRNVNTPSSSCASLSKWLDDSMIESLLIQAAAQWSMIPRWSCWHVHFQSKGKVASFGDVQLNSGVSLSLIGTQKTRKKIQFSLLIDSLICNCCWVGCIDLHASRKYVVQSERLWVTDSGCQTKCRLFERRRAHRHQVDFKQVFVWTVGG